MHPRIRRANISQEEKDRMKQMEAEGKKRAEIAKEIGVNTSVVTRHLGAKRKYGARLTEAEQAEIAKELSESC